MSISGFLPSDPFLQRILSPSSPKLVTPSVHVIGDNDVIVVPERSQILVDVCATENVRVERHEGGSYNGRLATLSYSFAWRLGTLICGLFDAQAILYRPSQIGGNFSRSI